VRYQLVDKNKKIKVLHVVSGMKHGGIETFLMSMLRTCDRQRFDMDILCTRSAKGPYTERARQLGADVTECPMSYDQVRFVYKLYKLLRRRRYDCLNSHLSDLGGGALLAALLAGIPYRVASYHQMRPDMGFIKNLYLWIMRRLVLRTATSITTSSPAVSRSYFGTTTAKGRIQAISYGVDTQFFAEKPKEPVKLSQLGFSPNNVIVGHLGTYRRQKNHQALVKIAALTVKQVPEARFLLCGRPVATSREPGATLYERIGRQIEQLGLSKFVVRIPGFDDVRQFYQAIDVFVLPSREEGMPVSIIEAQAAGKPVVASRIEGIVIATAPEMRDNLFDVDDVESFARCLVQLLKNKDRMKAQGLAGQAYVRENLDIKAAVRKYQELYLPQDKLND